MCLPINNCPCVSAGTIVHEETSWKAFNSVWTFIEEKLAEQNNQNCVKKNVQFEEDTKENLVNVPDGVKKIRTNMVSKSNTIQEAHSESRQVDNDVDMEVRKLIKQESEDDQSTSEAVDIYLSERVTENAENDMRRGDEIKKNARVTEKKRCKRSMKGARSS